MLGCGLVNYRILYQVYYIENSDPRPHKTQFLWCPGHSQVIGNEKAYLLAQKSTEKGKKIQSSQSPPPLLQTVALSTAWALFPLSFYARTANSKTGKFTKSIDKAPSPFKHTRSLYNGKPKHQAAILCQLRTGICRLNRYLGVIGAASSTVQIRKGSGNS